MLWLYHAERRGLLRKFANSRVPATSTINRYVQSNRRTFSTVPDPSGSGRVDMLKSPVAAARAAVATGAWDKSKHDMYLIRASVGA